MNPNRSTLYRPADPPHDEKRRGRSEKDDEGQ